MIFDGTDKPMEDIEVRLDSGEITRTAQQGLFFIKRPKAGKVTVRMEIDGIPSGYRTRTPIEKEFTAEPGKSIEYHMVFTADRMVSGRIFTDGDGDSVYTDNQKDRGIAGVRVTASGVAAITDAEGRYILRGLKPGSYSIEVDLKSLPTRFTIKKSPQPLEVPAEPYTRRDADFIISGASS